MPSARAEPRDPRDVVRRDVVDGDEPRERLREVKRPIAEQALAPGRADESDSEGGDELGPRKAAARVLLFT